MSKIMQIVMETIPQEDQRYDTVGDWEPDLGNGMKIRVTETGDWKYNLLVMIHEVIEGYLCYYHGVSDKDVTEFDTWFEKNRKPEDLSEAGDDPRAPYRREHFFATNIERLLAAELDVDWSKYDEVIRNL